MATAEAPREIPPEEFDISQYTRMEDVESTRNCVFQNIEQQIVAKQLPLNRTDVSNQMEMVRREIRIHEEMTLKHRDLVVPLIGWVLDREKNVAYILTKKYGHSLASSLKDKKRLFHKSTEIRKMQILYGIAKCMAYMHAEFFLHRDLKPENVLLDEQRKPRLCDFEFSRQFQVGITGSQLTQDIGTQVYEAPEVLQGRYGPKADVFSFGMMVYACFADEQWKFDDNTSPSSYLISQRKILEGRRYARPKNCSNFFWELINKCWDGDPHLRPSFEAIMETFRQFPSDKISDFVQQVDKDLAEFQEFKRQKQREMEAAARKCEEEMKTVTDERTREKLEKKRWLCQRRAEALAGTGRGTDSSQSPDLWDDGGASPSPDT